MPAGLKSWGAAVHHRSRSKNKVTKCCPGSNLLWETPLEGKDMKLRSSVVLAVFVAAAVLSAAAATIPAGSHATVRLNHSLSSATATAGQSWTGVLTSNIEANGKTMAKAGDPVKGKVTYVNRSGRLHKPGALSLRLISINGETV